MANIPQIKINDIIYDIKDKSSRELIDNLRNTSDRLVCDVNTNEIYEKKKIGSYMTIDTTKTNFRAIANDIIKVTISGEAVTNSVAMYFKYIGNTSHTYIATINKNTDYYYKLSNEITGLAFYSESHSTGEMTIHAIIVSANNIIKQEAISGAVFRNLKKNPTSAIIPVISTSLLNSDGKLIISIPKYTKFTVTVHGDALTASSSCTLYFKYSGDNSLTTIGTFPVDTESVFVAGKNITEIAIYATNLTVGGNMYIDTCVLLDDGAADKSGKIIAINQKNKIGDIFRCGGFSNGILYPKYATGNNAYISPFPVKSSTEYTFSTSEDATDENAAYYIIQLDNSMAYVSASVGMNKTKLPYTFKTNSNTSYIAITTYTAIGNGWAQTIPTWVQLEEGIYATEYENPYAIAADRIGYAGITAKLERDYAKASKNLVKEGFVCGKYTSTDGFVLVDNTGDNAAIPPIPIKPNTPYNLSYPADYELDNTYFYVCFLNSNKEIIYSSGALFKYNGQTFFNYQFISPATAAYAGIMTYGVESHSHWEKTIPSWVQFEEGDGSSEYRNNKVIDPKFISDNQILDSYYEGYIGAKVKRINELARACAANGDVFLFITDQHWRTNARKSPALIRYLSEHCMIPTVINGGDTEDYQSIEYCTTLRKYFKGKIYHVMGNHEWFTPDGNYLYYYADMYNTDQIGNKEQHYYYVDNPQNKMRYIILNAYLNDGPAVSDIYSGYTSEERTWLEQTALNIPEDWSVIVFTHAIDNGNTGAAETKAILDTAKSNGKDIIAIFQGHAHWDGICHTTGGIPIIITTCDKCKSWYHYETNMEPWLERDRIMGTIYEQAFEVVIIDRNQKEIHAVRIGALAMDNENIWSSSASGFDDTGVFEERTISYE